MDQNKENRPPNQSSEIYQNSHKDTLKPVLMESRPLIEV